MCPIHIQVITAWTFKVMRKYMLDDVQVQICESIFKLQYIYCSHGALDFRKNEGERNI